MFSYYFLMAVLVIAEAVVGSVRHDRYHPFLKRQKAFVKVRSSLPHDQAKPSEQLDASFWERKGALSLKQRLANLKASGWTSSSAAKSRPARNVILFMGDGMGVTTVTAMRKMKQQLNGTPFYNTQLAWDSFPFSAFSKTFSVDDVISESAATATAFLSGINTNTGFIGVDVTADPNCTSSKGYVDSIAHWAFAAGKKTGFVTTTRITHASPAPLYANTPWRGNELFLTTQQDDFSVLYPKCVDIARQFVSNGRHIAVALGGGRRNFLPIEKNGSRTDGKNLIKEWLVDRSKVSNHRPAYVQNLNELKLVNPRKTDYLLGLFSGSHMQYVEDRPQNQPRLADMTETAIKILNKNEAGFFLFVEGGRIDQGHHEGRAQYALTEGIEFDAAVERALSMVDLKETLVIVTADHSHTLSMGGWLRHQDSVFTTSYELAGDNKTFTSLAYANGPGAAETLVGPKAPFEGTRKNVSAAEAILPKYRQQATVILDSETHGGEDVGVHAVGVHSEYFSGVIDNSYIAWAMACAAGVQGGAGSSSQSKRLSAICPF